MKGIGGFGKQNLLALCLTSEKIDLWERSMGKIYGKDEVVS